MHENIRPKAILTLVLVLVALGCMVWNPLFRGEKPFELGLDLQGGTRLVYRFDFEDALAQHKITQDEFNDKPRLLQELIAITINRVNSSGLKDIAVRPEGIDRMVVELPGAAETGSSQIFGALKAPLTLSEINTLTLEGLRNEDLKQFPLEQGMIKIGSEKLIYKRRNAAELLDLRRGVENTTPTEHAAAARVELLTSDDIVNIIENVGDMQFLIAASANDYVTLGTDETKEKQKVDDWRKAHLNETADAYNRLTPEQGGPPSRLRWFPFRPKAADVEVAYGQRELVPLILAVPPGGDERAGTWAFTGADVDSFGATVDEFQYPALQFEMVSAKRDDFGNFTGGHLRRGMAIVLNGEIVTLATINEKLPGSGRISGGVGGFLQEEVNEMLTVLRSGALKIKPQPMNKSRIGASLGEASIKSGFISCLVAMGVVIVFMVFVYGRLGVISVICLVANMILLLGVLAFWRANLTLPGIAGIVLTMGMAVDGNILIYERLREEMTRGVKLVQAAKAAFERAAATIIDSNVTTLIAGVILALLGSGPIRGFATTLSFGILTTLFTVIVMTEVLVLWDIKRGTTTYKMRELVKDTKFNFLSVRKPALIISAIITIAGLVVFFSLPNHRKLGVDLIGGFSATVRTQEPHGESQITELVRQIDGPIGRSAMVLPITDSGSRATGYREFRVTAKLDDASTADNEASIQNAEQELRKALATVLERGPVEITLTPGATDSAVAGRLYFDEQHPTAEANIAAVLAESRVVSPVVRLDASGQNQFEISGTIAAGVTAESLKGDIGRRFLGRRDDAKALYNLRSPVPESASVGSQVGGELRDKAIRAMILALLGTILYLRVRFAEYAYGIAVVASLLHDCLITLGALAVANYTGFVHAEVDLAMIAAFLTIIGFSQNDTIVIFDRVRENRPKSNKPLIEVLNDSVNQTLGRTIFTTATVFLTVLVLFAFSYGSRSVIENFSFAMLIGVFTGTFSTVYIASPVLMWVEEWTARRAAKAELANKA